MNAEAQIGSLKHEKIFPWAAMIAICMGMLAHSVVFTAPLPFVAFMVVDFHMAEDVDAAGYWAGWITGMFMIGRTIASVGWGMAADRWGRKPSLLLSMFNVAIFGIFFGMSQNFLMAIVWRLSIGLGNGFMAVAKTTITEIVSCKEHEIRAFGFLNGIWGLGLIVGPALGGLLSRPAIQYPSTFTASGLWGYYPYLLPCIVCSSLAIIALIGIFFFVPETLFTNRSATVHDPSIGLDKLAFMKRMVSSFRNRHREHDIEYSKISDSTEHGQEVVQATNGLVMDEVPNAEQASIHQIETVTADEEVGKGENGAIEMTSLELKNINTSTKGGSDQDGTTTPILPIESKALPASFHEIIHDKHIILLLLLYGSFCFIVMFIDETMPLWCVTSTQKGGLAWDSAEVGIILASCGLGIVIFQLLLYEPMIRRYFQTGPGDTFCKLVSFASVWVAILPFGAAFAEHFTASKPLQHILHSRFHDPLPSNMTVTSTFNSTDILSLGPDQTNLVSVESERNVSLHLVIIFCLILYRVGIVSAFSTLGIVVNSSVSKEMRGTINGLIMTAGSLGNAGGPIVGSIFYAVCITVSYIQDGRIIFIIAALLGWILAILAKYKLLRD